MPIVSDVQLLLNDSGTFWPEASILDAINEAQLCVQAQIKWQRQSWSLPLAQGADLIPLPAGVLIPGWIEAAVDGSTTRAFPTTHRELENYSRTWRNSPLDVPRYFVIWDASTLRVWPRPKTAYTYTLWGVPYPTEVSSSSASLDGPPQFTHCVTHYAVSILLEATRPDLADQHLEEALSSLKSWKKTLRNQQSHRILTLRPALAGPQGRFTLRQAGIITSLPVYYPLESN